MKSVILVSMLLCLMKLSVVNRSFLRNLSTIRLSPVVVNRKLTRLMNYVRLIVRKLLLTLVAVPNTSSSLLIMKLIMSSVVIIKFSRKNRQNANVLTFWPLLLTTLLLLWQPVVRVYLLNILPNLRLCVTNVIV